MRTIQEQLTPAITTAQKKELELIRLAITCGHDSENFLRLVLSSVREAAEDGTPQIDIRLEQFRQRVQEETARLERKKNARQGSQNHEQTGFTVLGDALSEQLDALKLTLTDKKTPEELPDYAQKLIAERNTELDRAIDLVQGLRDEMERYLHKSIRNMAQQGRPLDDAVKGIKLVGEKIIRPLLPVTYRPGKTEILPPHMTTLRNGNVLTTNRASGTENPEADVMDMQALDTLFLLSYPKTPVKIPSERVTSLLQRMVYGPEVIEDILKKITELEAARPNDPSPEQLEIWISLVKDQTPLQKEQTKEPEAALTH
jgi:hypothetical protein